MDIEVCLDVLTSRCLDLRNETIVLVAHDKVDRVELDNPEKLEKVKCRNVRLGDSEMHSN